jgi:hypothetical protein
MAERTATYLNVTRDQLQRIQQALLASGVQISSAPGSSLLGRQFDAGSFDTNGYSVNYSFAPTDVSGQVGTLTVRVSGSMLFIGTAMNRLDASIRPYITVS